MKTTAKEKDCLREIISHLDPLYDKRWLANQCISVGDKQSYWVLNYGIDRHNEYNRLCRGLVVAKRPARFKGDLLTLIRSFPFIRFFNKHEGPADPIDFANAEMIEKLDGTMVGVFFPTNHPRDRIWHTRRMISTSKEDLALQVENFHGGTCALLPLIGNYVRDVRFKSYYTHYCFVFEFIHDATMVITKYQPEQYGLYLIGARNVSNYEEMAEEELDEAAERLRVKRPQRWQANLDEEEIKKRTREVEERVEDFEGFVFRDKETGKRIKLKNEEYVVLHHLMSNLSYKRLLVKFLEGETKEIIAYFPNAEERLQQIQLAYNEYFEKCLSIILFWRNQKLDRKTLADRIFRQKEEKDRWISSQIMTFFEESGDDKIQKELDANLRKIALGQGKNDGSPKKLLDKLNLDNTET